MTTLFTLPCLLESFENSALLMQALTHRSFGLQHNQRLEFMGDAVLSVVIADCLYRAFPDITEDVLTAWRARLVNNQALATLAHELGLSAAIQVGPGEPKADHMRASILADALEALIGAIYLDKGWSAAQRQIVVWFKERFQNVHQAQKDPKTLLQEYTQAKKWGAPIYRLRQTMGPAHDCQFMVEVLIHNQPIEIMVGEGRSRRQAEQAAAQQLIDLLKTQGLW